MVSQNDSGILVSFSSRTLRRRNYAHEPTSFAFDGPLALRCALDDSGKPWIRSAPLAARWSATAYMRRGLQRAIACGRLLIEVKAKLGHGQWLPFLRKYCRVPERTASHYMRLAHHEDEIGKFADLTVSGALALITKEPAPTSLSGFLATAAAKFDSPLDDSDFEASNAAWLEQKILHRAKAPPVTSISLGLMRDHGIGLCFAPIDEIIETIKIMVSICKGRLCLPVHTVTRDHVHIDIIIAAQRVIVALWDEIERRNKLGGEDRYWADCQKTSGVLKTRLAEWRAERHAIH